ncbi:TetR family transcriptional regulator [Streptomyces sp. NPDC086843]|uniref:TetR family transcriptional regulator n=1 Tax=Streptomyces sp. NPDC086843 TaxID=3365763 RepID=UPI00382BA6A2
MRRLRASTVDASPLRQQAAARTREQVLRCAAGLFAGRGYGRVTVADIAAAAGVSPKTVFAQNNWNDEAR